MGTAGGNETVATTKTTTFSVHDGEHSTMMDISGRMPKNGDVVAAERPRWFWDIPNVFEQIVASWPLRRETR